MLTDALLCYFNNTDVLPRALTMAAPAVALYAARAGLALRKLLPPLDFDTLGSSGPPTSPDSCSARSPRTSSCWLPSNLTCSACLQTRGTDDVSPPRTASVCGTPTPSHVVQKRQVLLSLSNSRKLPADMSRCGRKAAA